MISVIVPIYNVEKYLPKCIESIINQTYKDLEIILVDDGSPDRCGQICDEYAAADARIKVIHKVNGGLSDARNAGIDIAKGEYISFVDSDDYISHNMLEYLLSNLKHCAADVSVCLYEPFYEGAEIDKQLRQPPENIITMSGAEAMADIFTYKKSVSTVAWNKLYKARLFTDTNIRYPFGRIGEDMFTTYKILYHADKVVCSNQKLYYYLLRNDSIMGRPLSTERLSGIDAARGAIEFVENHCSQLLEHAYCYFFGMHLLILKDMVNDSNRQKWYDKIKELRCEIFSVVPGPLSNPHLTIQHRIEILLLRLGLWIYIPTISLWSTLKGSRKKYGKSC